MLRWLRNEEGIALVMALGVMFVLTISALAVITLTASNSRSASYNRTTQRTQAAAEAGLNYGASILANSATPGDPSAFPPGSTTIDGVPVSWSGSLSGSVWTITATATLANPTAGTAAVTRTATGQFQVSASPAGGVWDYVYAGTTSCTVIQNTVVFAAPIYTRGDLCIKNDVQMVGPRVDVMGGIQVENAASVGSSPSDASDPAVRTTLGCRLGSSGSFQAACATDSEKQVWRSSFSNSPPDLTRPPLDLAYWKANAKPGPSQYCTSGSFPGGPSAFSGTGVIDIMPSSTYDCSVYSGSTLVGRIAWNDTTKVLNVHGVIYFNGELVVDGTQLGTYDGDAVLYFEKKVNIKNTTQICAVAGCDPTWNPNDDLLVIVSGDSSVPAFEIQNDAKFQGGAYAVGGFKIQNLATMQGPVVADVIDVQNNGFPTSWTSITSLIPGMPSSSSGGAGTVTYIEGSWRN